MEINSRCVPSPGIGLVINYMLDTNTCIHVITGRVASVRERLQAIPPEQIRVSAVVVAELQFGISLAAPLLCPAAPAGACHPEPAGVRTVAGSKCGGLVRLQLWCLDGISGI